MSKEMLFIVAIASCMLGYTIIKIVNFTEPPIIQATKWER